MAGGDLEVLIAEYLEGRLEGTARQEFEARMKADPELERKVHTTTSSILLLREVLAKVDPGEGFEEKVSNRIENITQSNPQLRSARRPGGPLSAADPEAQLFGDPQAARERLRLAVLAALAVALCAAAVLVILSLALR
jgi:anti-sigma factor RsiW